MAWRTRILDQYSSTLWLSIKNFTYYVLSQQTPPAKDLLHFFQHFMCANCGHAFDIANIEFLTGVRQEFHSFDGISFRLACQQVSSL